MNTASFKIFVTEIGALSAFTGRFFREFLKPRYEFAEMVNQGFYIGNQSLALVGMTGFIMGLVITIQTYPSMQTFGAESWIPAVVSVSLVREIIPVTTAIICAGKIGSGIGAELGSMRVTEQIDAMEVSSTDPFKYLVITRVVAATLMVPLLVVLGDVVALFGAYLGVNLNQDVSFNLFTNQVFGKLTFGDLVPSVIKSVFFGFAIGVIGSFKGYTTTNGTQGVGQAANSAVVASTFAVFLIDLMSAQITNIFNIR